LPSTRLKVKRKENKTPRKQNSKSSRNSYSYIYDKADFKPKLSEEIKRVTE
jgi:lysylphosphatidylglycerol synthetase-like protein (DUF2156 family)